MTDVPGKPEERVYSVPEKIRSDGIFLIRFGAGNIFYREDHLLYDKKCQTLLSVTDLLKKPNGSCFPVTHFDLKYIDIHLSGVRPDDSLDGAIKVFEAKELPYETSGLVRQRMQEIVNAFQNLEQSKSALENLL